MSLLLKGAGPVVAAGGGGGGGFPRSANLVAYYKLDETSGTRADGTSNHLDLTDNGTCGSTTGKLGNCYTNSGWSSAKYFSRATNSLFTPASAMSVSCWIQTGIAQANHEIAAVWEGNAAGSGSWLLAQDGSPHIKVNISKDGTYDVGTYGVGGTALSLNTWYNVVFVFDGSQSGNANRLKIYVNGVAETVTFTGTIPSSIATAASAFLLGQGNHGYGNYWQGLIDEFTIWSAALSASDVTALYNSGNGITYP